MDEFETVVNDLFSLRPPKRTGLDTMKKHCEALGHPEESFPIVHVAGTNGKGTAATKIARGLQAAGLRVGLYTSPHIVSFCERISVNGEFIPQALVVR